MSIWKLLKISVFPCGLLLCLLMGHLWFHFHLLQGLCSVETVLPVHVSTKAPQVNTQNSRPDYWGLNFWWAVWFWWVFELLCDWVSSTVQWKQPESLHHRIKRVNVQIALRTEPGTQQVVCIWVLVICCWHSKMKVWIVLFSLQESPFSTATICDNNWDILFPKKRFLWSLSLLFWL